MAGYGQNKKKAIAYKSLRDFVKNIADINATDLDAEVGEAIDKSEKTTQNISRGKRSFTWEEAVSVAKMLVSLAKPFLDQNTSVAMQALTRGFLLSNVPSIGGEDLQKETIDDILGQWFELQGQVGTVPQPALVRYNNIPDYLYSDRVIRENLQQQIFSAINGHKIVYLSGITGTGKSFIAVTIARKLFEEQPEEFQCAIWIECTKGRNAVDDAINNILAAFGIKNTGNITRSEKYNLVEEYLRQEKGIIIFDALEAVIDSGEKNELLQFITEKIPNHWVIFVTCGARFSAYRKKIRSSNRIHEIKMEDLTFEEWQVLSKISENSRSDIKEAKEAFPELDQIVYERFKGNPYMMIHVLATLSEKLLTGTSFERITTEYSFYESDEDSFHNVFEKTINALTENCVILLITLSLFETPVSARLIQLVSNLDGVEEDGSVKIGSDLEKSILRCHNLFMIERYRKNDVFYFFLPAILKPILNQVLIDRVDDFQSLIDRWIDYYRRYSAEIGFCFDDFNRLEKLDSDSNVREIENIICVLNFCETTGRWEDFYEISENTKYYFYTRGISGEGSDSVHYKRACAARRLGRSINEFNSLLYHCNVMCKAKVWNGLDECFSRMDELLAADVEISDRDRMKYKYLKALHEYSIGQYESALASFKRYEKEIKEKMNGVEEAQWDKILLHDYIACLRWHCECILALSPAIHREGRSEDAVMQMNGLLDEAMRLSERVNFERSIVHSLLLKLRISREFKGSLGQVNSLLAALDNYQSVIKNDAVYSKQYNQYRQS